jgi:hypothetical protein
LFWSRKLRLSSGGFSFVSRPQVSVFLTVLGTLIFDYVMSCSGSGSGSGSGWRSENVLTQFCCFEVTQFWGPMDFFVLDFYNQ